MTKQEPFRVIVADPPWKHVDRMNAGRRGAAHKYKVMDTSEIMRYPLPRIDGKAVLFMWRLANMPQDALDVIKAWGFVPKTEIVWQKLTKHGKQQFGQGHYVRASHESCIIAVRGRFRVAKKDVRSRFEARMPVDERGKYIHSAKPDEFFAIVERLVGDQGPRLELFARKRRDGWTQIGDQLEEVKP